MAKKLPLIVCIKIARDNSTCEPLKNNKHHLYKWKMIYNTSLTEDAIQNSRLICARRKTLNDNLLSFN